MIALHITLIVKYKFARSSHQKIQFSFLLHQNNNNNHKIKIQPCALLFFCWKKKKKTANNSLNFYFFSNWNFAVCQDISTNFINEFFDSHSHFTIAKFRLIFLLKTKIFLILFPFLTNQLFKTKLFST